MAESAGRIELQRIRCEEVTVCLLCATAGRALYSGLSDRYFAVPGTWNVVHCPNCQLLWLNPRPISADLGRLYTEYYTHSVSKRYARPTWRQAIKQALWATHCGYSDVLLLPKFWERAGHWFGIVPSLRRKAERELLYLHRRSGGGRLLDIGCGDGSFLRQMRDLGWEVYGIEQDPKAAQVARREFGLDVREGGIADVGFPNDFFDAIVLSHVIEHVPDPVAMLRQCHALLMRSGRLVAATPNGASLGHRLQKEFWKELDPPRHLYIFTPATLARCAEKAGFRIDGVSSSCRNARQIWIDSRRIQRQGRMAGNGSSLLVRLEGLGFSLMERVISTVLGREVSEEITLIASKIE